MKKSFLNWIKASFEGVDGNASSRKLTNFWFVVIVTGVNLVIAVFSLKARDEGLDIAANLLKWTLIVDCTMLLLLFGVITAQNVINFITKVKYGDAKTNERTE